MTIVGISIVSAPACVAASSLGTVFNNNFDVAADVFTVALLVKFAFAVVVILLLINDSAAVEVVAIANAVADDLVEAVKIVAMFCLVDLAGYEANVSFVDCVVNFAVISSFVVDNGIVVCIVVLGADNVVSNDGIAGVTWVF